MSDRFILLGNPEAFCLLPNTGCQSVGWVIKTLKCCQNVLFLIRNPSLNHINIHIIELRYFPAIICCLQKGKQKPSVCFRACFRMILLCALVSLNVRLLSPCLLSGQVFPGGMYEQCYVLSANPMSSPH